MQEEQQRDGEVRDDAEHICRFTAARQQTRDDHGDDQREREAVEQKCELLLHAPSRRKKRSLRTFRYHAMQVSGETTMQLTQWLAGACLAACTMAANAADSPFSAK